MTEAIARVQGAEPAPPTDIEEPSTPQDRELEAKIQEYRERGQKFLDANMAYFQSFARDTTIRFRLGSKFFIDMDHGIVNLDASWFFEHDMDERQIVWACLHELSHFLDLADDPEGMRKGFEHLRDRARATGDTLRAKWAQAWGAAYPEVLARASTQVLIDEEDPTRGTMDRFQQMAFQFHHGFLNSLDDIHVNGRVSRNALSYDPQLPDGQRVLALYREKLFKETDYSTLPRHLQFGYALLRERMVPGEELMLSPDVQEALSRSIVIAGMEYPVRDIVERFIVPRATGDSRASTRYGIIRESLEKVFLELLDKDIQDWKPAEPKPQPPPQPGQPGGPPRPPGSQEPPQPGEPGEGGDEDNEPGAGGPVIEGPWSGPYREHKKRTPDHISDEDRDKFRQRREQQKKEEEQNLGRRLREQQDRQFCEREHITLEQLQRYRDLMKRVGPHLDELSALWSRIIGTGGVSTDVVREPGFRRGRLNVGDAIRQWPEITTRGSRNVRVMERMTERPAEAMKPELIRVRLVCDQSGSMYYDKGAKMRTLTESITLVLASLNDFQTRLNLSRNRTGSDLQVDTEVRLFGSKEQIAKPLRTAKGKPTDRGDIIRSFSALGRDFGSTADHVPLKAIRDSYDKEQQEDMREGRIMELVIEITDGGADAPEMTRKQVDSLLAGGAVVRALQIGDVDADEQRRFAAVWNDGRQRPLGEIIGTNLSRLPVALAQLIEEYLGRVEI